MSKAQFVTVTTTLANKAQANRLGRVILEARLAACVQLWPIHSLYWWKGKIESAREIALVCKTRAHHAAKLESFIAGRHPYEVPEIIVAPIHGGLPAYLAWMAAETAPAPRQPRLTFPAPPTKKSPSRKGRKT
jgi:periplasmic divalent cation tolerance protein